MLFAKRQKANISFGVLIVMCVSFTSHIFQSEAKRKESFMWAHKLKKARQECAAPKKGAKWSLFRPAVLLPLNPTLLEDKKNWRRKGGEWVAFGETASSLAAANWEIYFDITEKTICLHSRIIFLCKVNPLLLLLLLSNWEIYFTTRSILYKTPFPAALAKK